MGWSFVRQGNNGERRGKFSLGGQHLQLFLLQSDSNLVAVPTVSTDKRPQVVGIVSVGAWSVKLEAVRGSFKVTPHNPRSDATIDPPTEEYILRAKEDEHTEIVFLREGDRICSPGAVGGLVLTWDSPQVQVNSSVTGEGEIPESEDQQEADEPADVAKPENPEETEDEEDLDRTLVPGVLAPSKSQLSRSTPLPSGSRTEVVQETPAANRTINAPTEYSGAVAGRGDSDVVENTPPLDETAAADAAEAFSTTPTKLVESESHRNKAGDYARNPDGLLESKQNGALEETMDVEMSNGDDDPPVRPVRHPKIKIPARTAKRASPAEDETESNTSNRSGKRRKIDAEGLQDTIAVHTPVKKTVRKTAQKGKKRLSDVQQEETPPRSQRDSQRSVAAEGEYDGPKPRVAFSNSAIQPNGSHMKFLKKHGGVGVESVTDDCNILCVKDGPLAKTMKLLQSIALGIPIVCDKWLIDSAKAGHFLPLRPYIPSAPAQEKEWNFSIAQIWNQPQNTLFQRYIIYFTPALKGTYAQFAEIEEVCKAVGARRVVVGKKAAGGKEVDAQDTILLAKEDGDEDAVALVESGKTCFSKDFLTNSILRGAVDLESDEFKIKAGPTASEQPKRKGRPRKS